MRWTYCHLKTGDERIVIDGCLGNDDLFSTKQRLGLMSEHPSLVLLPSCRPLRSLATSKQTNASSLKAYARCMLSLHGININPLFNAQLMAGKGGVRCPKSEVARKSYGVVSSRCGADVSEEAGSKLESVMHCGFPRARYQMRWISGDVQLVKSYKEQRLVLRLGCGEPSTNERLATNRRRIDAVPFLCCHKLTLSFPIVFSVVVLRSQSFASRRGPLIPYYFSVVTRTTIMVGNLVSRHVQTY
jgi:hypothetical protein